MVLNCSAQGNQALSTRPVAVEANHTGQAVQAWESRDPSYNLGGQMEIFFPAQAKSGV